MNYKTNRVLPILGLVLPALIGAGAAQAQEDAGGIPFGPFTAYPTLGISYGYDDNVALTSDNEISSTFFLISPGIRLQTSSGKSTYVLQYQAEIGRYQDTDFDDFEDQAFLAQWSYEPTTRHRLDVSGEYRKGHDPRGTGSREGDDAFLPLEVDKWTATGLGTTYSYGTAGAKGRLDLEAGYFDREYDNNRFYTVLRDREDLYYGGTFFWRIGARTNALFDVLRRDIDYDVATLDNEETHYYVGLDWEATAKTTGRIGAGRLEKDFDDPTREDFSGTGWQAGLEWRPRSYSVVDISTARETDETNGFGDYILREDLVLGWTHDWNSRFTTIVDFGVADEENRPGIRDDDITFWGASLNYQMRRWLLLGAGYEYYDRESTVSEFNYDRSVYLLTVEMYP